MQNEIIKLSQQLMACPSITPNDMGCQKIIAEQLKKIGFNIQYINQNNVSNLWAQIGNEKPLFVFAGHTDVVPPGQGWLFDPFTPTLHNHQLVGRGAADMKTAIAAMIVAVKTWIQSHPLKGSIAFLITSDEEGPAIDGTRKVLELLKPKIDYCIVGEASSEKKVGDQIRVGRRGSLHGTLVIYGKQGHIAYPDKIKNPIHYSLKVLDELVNTIWDKGNEYFPPTSFQISNYTAGTGAANVVPGQATILFNFRFSTEVTPDILQSKVEKILDAHQLKYNINWSVSALPFLTHQGKLTQVISDAVFEVTGLKPAFSTGGGTSDARFIAPLGAEVIELGVLNETVHEVNECVPVADLKILGNIYLNVLTRLMSASS